jgi:citrate/tricarballylate utilization protein
MQTLDSLTREARQLAEGGIGGAQTAVAPVQFLSLGGPSGPAAESDAEREVARQMVICNACRYCEGFCGVFPAMTRRLEFGKADVHYLANLCHNCGACLHACQYAPPHEFAVNVPRAMARLRGQTYSDYAWPAALGGLYRRNGLVVALALAFALALFLMLGAARQGSLWGQVAEGSFYAIFPHGMMVAMFLPVFGFASLAIGLGVMRFWRAVKPATGNADLGGPAAAEGAHAALRLKYLDGGHGEGCHNEDDGWTQARRRYHHLTFYGFMLCFAATSIATLYHYVFGWVAPYGWTSLPKLFGITGGVAMVIGTTGLWRLRLRRHPDHLEPSQHGMDLGFIALLFLTAATGLALMLVRETAALPFTLCVHLGAVMALFLTMPYGKFAHGFYRTAALLRHAVERRLPNRLGLSGE